MRGIVRGVASRAWAAVLVGTLAASMLAPIGAAAEPAAEPEAIERSDEIVTYELPLDTVRSVLGGDDEVYVTGDDELLVIDLDGDIVAVVEDLPGAGPLGLDPGGEVLFVGLRGTHEVVALDVEDLEELDAWDLPAAPISLAVTDEYLHVGVGTSSWSDRIVTIHVEGDVVERSVSWSPILSTLGEELLVARSGISSGQVSRHAADGAAHVPAVSRDLGGYVRDIAGDADTGRIWVAGSGQVGPNYSVHALDPASLATTTTLQIGAHPVAVAPLAGGAHVAAGRATSPSDDPDVTVWDVASQQPIARLWLDGRMVRRGLTVTSDGTLAALTANDLRGRSWLTVVPAPVLALPELEIDQPRAVVGQPFDVTGRVLTAAGAPVTGVDLRLVAPDGSVTSSSTDAEGRFTFSVPAIRTVGRFTFELSSDGGPTDRPVAAEIVVEFRGTTPTITAHAAPVQVAEPLVVTGSVTDPRPVVNAPVIVEILRSGVPVAVQEGRTDDDGRYEVRVHDLAGGRYDVLVRVPATATHHAGEVTRSTSVRRIGTTLDLTADLTVGIPGYVTGRLTDERGQPVAGTPVALMVLDGAPLATVTTGEDGGFAVPYTAATSGEVLLKAVAEETATHETAAGYLALRAAQDRPRHAFAPVSATALTPVTLRGTVTDSLGRPAGELGGAVDVRDADGLAEHHAITTDAKGQWSVTFTPRRGGTHQIAVTTFGGDRLQGATTTHSFTVAKATTAITLGALTTPVAFGQPITLSAHLPAPRAASVDLVAVNLATGTEKRLARTTTDSNGRLAFDTVARANTRYEARFRGNATYAPSTAARTVRVRSVVTASLSGHDRTVSGEPSYPRQARPTVNVRVRSVAPATTVTVTLQRWNGEKWVAAQRWTAKTATDGRVTTRVPTGLGAGRYRVRVTAPETPSNLAGNSAWVRLRVR